MLLLYERSLDHGPCADRWFIVVCQGGPDRVLDVDGKPASRLVGTGEMIKGCGQGVDDRNVLPCYERREREMNDRPVEARITSTFDAPSRPVPSDGQHMRISIGGDHAGFDLKKVVGRHLKDKGSEVLDRGTDSKESTDYPDYAHAVAHDVETGAAEVGIIVCGSANGVNITANKHRGVRSAIAWNEEVARLAREHNDANVLALPARFVDEELAMRIVDAFLAARFEGGRHQRRVEKIEPDPEQRS